MLRPSPSLLLAALLLTSAACTRAHSPGSGADAAAATPAAAPATPSVAPAPEITKAIAALIEAHQKAAPMGNAFDALFPPGTRLRSAEVVGQEVRLVFNERLGYRPWSKAQKAELEAALRGALGKLAPDGATLVLRVRYGDDAKAMEASFDEHVTDVATIRAREQQRTALQRLANPVVRPTDYAGPSRERGLAGSHLMMSASHGWTWHKENRWQLQRARVYTIVEDLYPMAYINPFLIPMLENAGAVVFSARERDFQTAEVIVDNDGADPRSTLQLRGAWETSPARGWRGGRPGSLAPFDEPFKAGRTLTAPAGSDATALYLPYVPRDGRYAVYVSWAHAATNSPSVPVEVRHLGGVARFVVNQQVAAGTWIYLGHFEFAQGTSEENGSVTILAKGAAESPEAAKGKVPTRISIDAVRFGGGMGNAAPEGLISGHPRYAEGARYWAQYAGAPPEMVTQRPTSEGHFGEDYNRDIASRPEFTNYLQGNPAGPNNFRTTPGLGVPIDLKLGWHTDAGYDEGGLIGTLSIYRVRDDEGNETFPDGRSRWLNRDLTALMQEEIVRTGRELYTSSWVRRAVQEGNYGEARRPNMPSTLLELLSHHNFNDMKYGLDPRFQHDMARAVYKGILRFVAAGQGYDPIVLPLPVQRIAARSLGDGKVEVTWAAQPDPLEPSATPTGYLLQQGPDGRSFDGGIVATEPRAVIDVPADTTRYFRVLATNGGGASLPSAVAAVRWSAGKQPVLIVDGFDRVAGPAQLDQPGLRGFSRAVDPGVGWGYQITVGDQYDYNPASEWKNDLEAPGLGASSNDLEHRLLKGNFFDNVVTYAQDLSTYSVPFDSSSASAFPQAVSAAKYQAVLWAAGKQRTTMPPIGITEEGQPDRMKPAFQVLPAAERAALQGYLAQGGRLLLSGAYVAEDLMHGPLADDQSRAFATQTLGVALGSSRATRINFVLPEPGVAKRNDVGGARFGKDLLPSINLLPTVYEVESAESLKPVRASLQPQWVYGDSGTVAALADDKLFLAGFPLESILPAASRTRTVGAALVQLGVLPSLPPVVKEKPAE